MRIVLLGLTLIATFSHAVVDGVDRTVRGWVFEGILYGRTEAPTSDVLVSSAANSSTVSSAGASSAGASSAGASSAGASSAGASSAGASSSTAFSSPATFQWASALRSPTPPATTTTEGGCPSDQDRDWAAGLNPSFDGSCNFTVDGITYRSDKNLWDGSLTGTLRPSYGNGSYSAIWNSCGLESIMYDNVSRTQATPGDDLIAPNQNSWIKHYVIKNSVLGGTQHLEGGHEDVIQLNYALHDGGWFVLQDSIIKNNDTNLMMSMGTGLRYYGSGNSFNYIDLKLKCDDAAENSPPGSPAGQMGTGGLLFQGAIMGPNDAGWTGGGQISIGDPVAVPLPEVWFVDSYYDPTYIGINFIDTVGKVIVVAGAGNGGGKGWPGPLKPRRPNGDTMTAVECPNKPGGGSGWDAANAWCCPNGQINTGGQVFSWQTGGAIGDNPANGAIPIYCYDDIETALADGHTPPPHIELSPTGWSSRGWTP